MPISRRSFLQKNKNEPKASNKEISVHSKGLPKNMLNNNDEEENIISEVLEDDYVEEISLPSANNIKIAQNPTTSDIQAMQHALAQTIHHNAPQATQMPQNQNYTYVPPPQLPPQEQYAPQTEIFSQPLPQQEYVPPQMRSNPPAEETGYAPLTSEDVRLLELKASFEDPDKPLYIINLTTQAVFFTNLYGPDTEINECTMGTVDNRDPSMTYTPYLIVPAAKKPLALQHEYFVKYLQKGYIKAVTQQEYRNFSYNYDVMLSKAIERKEMMEQISQQNGDGMISMHNTGRPDDRSNNPHYQQYLQTQMNNRGFGTEVVNVMGTGNELVNPNDINRQQSIRQQTGVDVDPESSWGSLYS